MNIKKKMLALMVSIACSGLLYGVNANAAAVGNFDTADNALTEINSALTTDSFSNDSDHPNLYVSDNSLDSITTDLGIQTKGEKIENFTGYKDDAKAANITNKNWTTKFENYLTNNDAAKGDGLLKKISNSLKEDSADQHFRVVGRDGVTGNYITSAAQAADTLLNLIDLAQQAKAADTDGKDTHYTDFLKKYAANLQILGVTDGGGNLTSNVAATTFAHLVDVSDKGLSLIPVSKLRQNIAFLKESNATLSGDIAAKITVSNKLSGRQNGGETELPSDGATLATPATLEADLTNVDNNTVIASKGTKLGIKDNKITYGGNDVGLATSTYSHVYLNGKINQLGQVAIDNSNVQGSGNTVLARSELVVDNSGNAYNLAEGMTVLGNNNTIESNGIVVGNGNTVGEDGTVVGNNSRATAPNAIAFGNNAVAEHENAVALGSDSRTTQKNEINVGMWKLNAKGDAYEQTGLRTITGVADGEDKHAAVNRGQLDDLAAYTNKQVTAAGEAANTYTDNKVNGLKQEMNGKIDALDKKVNKGFAANAALSGLFQPYGVGKVNLTAGVGGYQSESAVAVGVGYRVNENVAVKGGIATAVGNGSSTMYNASVNFEW